MVWFRAATGLDDPLDLLGQVDESEGTFFFASVDLSDFADLSVFSDVEPLESEELVEVPVAESPLEDPPSPVSVVPPPEPFAEDDPEPPRLSERASFL